MLSDEQLAGLTGGGWSGLDGVDLTEAQREDPNEVYAKTLEQYENDTIVAKAFSTASGKQALELIRERTIEQPAFRPDIANPAEMGYFREGENNMYRWILNCIRRSGDGPPSKPKKEK